MFLPSINATKANLIIVVKDEYIKPINYIGEFSFCLMWISAYS